MLSVDFLDDVRRMNKRQVRDKQTVYGTRLCAIPGDAVCSVRREMTRDRKSSVCEMCATSYPLL